MAIDKQIAEPNLRVVSAEEVDVVQLDCFMRGYFSEQHCDFLQEHALWRYRSNQNRVVVINANNRIIGYCAVVPAVIWLLNKKMSALFWVDMYVPPEYRGQGIQHLADVTIRRMTGLKLGFPNKLASGIHRKHGWDVREDYQIMLLPLYPPKVAHLRIMSGLWGLVLRCAAQLVRPTAWLYRRWLDGYEPVSAQILQEPDPEFLATIFHRHRDGWVTSNRSYDFIRWRYLESPYRSQYMFIIGGSGSDPSLAVVFRTLKHMGVTVTRILDIFGDLADKEGLLDVLRLTAREAARQGASQVTAAASNPFVRTALRDSGFIVSSRLRFCWFSQDAEMMRIIAENPCHWVLADSDNDSVD